VENYKWITATILFVMLSGTGIYLTPTDGYDVCRKGASYGTWTLEGESIKVDNKDLSAVGRYHCDVEDLYRYCGRATKTRCYKILEKLDQPNLAPIITEEVKGFKQYHNVLEPAKTKLRDFEVKDIIPLDKKSMDFTSFESITDNELNQKLIEKGTYLKHDYQLEQLKEMYPRKIKVFNDMIEESPYQEQKDEYIIERDRLIEKYKVVLLEEEVRKNELFYRNPVGTTYYIDCENGNDGAAGTAIGTAWETIRQYTTTTVRTAGDIGIIRANTECNQTADIIFDEDGTSDQYIQLIGANSINDPWSDSSDVKPIIDFNGGNFNVYLAGDTYWKFNNLNIKSSTDSSGLFRMSSDSRQIVVFNSIINNSGESDDAMRADTGTSLLVALMDSLIIRSQS